MEVVQKSKTAGLERAYRGSTPSLARKERDMSVGIDSPECDQLLLDKEACLKYMTEVHSPWGFARVLRKLDEIDRKLLSSTRS